MHNFHPCIGTQTCSKACAHAHVHRALRESPFIKQALVYLHRMLLPFLQIKYKQPLWFQCPLRMLMYLRQDYFPISGFSYYCYHQISAKRVLKPCTVVTSLAQTKHPSSVQVAHMKTKTKHKSKYKKLLTGFLTLLTQMASWITHN